MPAPEAMEVASPEPEVATTLRDVEAYWTADAMGQAQPMEADLDEDPIVALTAAAPWTQEGSPTVMESPPPDRSPIRDHQDLIDTPNRFQTARVSPSDREEMPDRAVGKMFMTFPDRNGTNHDYVGTGWVIAEQGVFTAGHCVFHKPYRTWATNILFIPQYDQEAAPLGRWSAREIDSLQEWTQRLDFQYDLAGFVTDRPIRPRTGSLGWMANYAPNQGPYQAVGYPASAIPGYPFNGCHRWQSVGGYLGGTNPIQMYNNMTQGCSGGPWIVTHHRKVYANGLNSHRDPRQPGTMYSPYCGNGFLNLYDKLDPPSKATGSV